MMMSVTTECAIPACDTNGFQTLKGEHQVRYDDATTPDQTITDGAEPNSKLTAKMSVSGSSTAAPVAGARGSQGSDNGQSGRLGQRLRDGASRTAVNIAKHAAADIEGYSEAAK